MVDLLAITKNLTNELNKNTVGLTFKLFNDTGKFKRAIRKYNQVIDYVNGIVSVSSSDFTKTSDGLLVGTMTARTEFLVRCKDTEEDVSLQVEQMGENNTIETVTEVIQGNESFIESVRTFLDTFSQNNTYTELSDEEGNTFDVSVAYSLAVPGIRQQFAHVGDGITFVLYSYYNFVQNGENSLRYKFILDGVQIPYTRATTRRAPTVESDVYMNTKDGSAKSTVSNTVWGYSLACPTFVGEFSKTVKNYLLNGERNVAHFLDVVMNDVSRIYLVLFGESSLTTQGILNAGQELSFAEAPEDYDLISFPSDFSTYAYTGNATTLTLTFTKETYVLSTVDFEPKKAVLSDGVYTVELAVENGCYLISNNVLGAQIEEVTEL